MNDQSMRGPTIVEYLRNIGIDTVAPVWVMSVSLVGDEEHVQCVMYGTVTEHLPETEPVKQAELDYDPRNALALLVDNSNEGQDLEMFNVPQGADLLCAEGTHGDKIIVINADHTRVYVGQSENFARQARSVWAQCMVTYQ